MKSIHILPTDKPSRLSINCETGLLQLGLDNRMFHDDMHIYITSNEEIKKGDWCYHPLLKGGSIIQSKFDEPNSTMKKIILTTDQDLIKDGVQEINDEFLEWFVKNPSCEKVGIIDDKKLSSKSIYDAVEGDLVYSHHGYGGIINSLSKDVRVGIDNYIETAITSETGWETLDINNYKIYDKCYKIIIPSKDDLKIGDNTNFGIITDINEKSVCFGKNKVGVDVWYKKSYVVKFPNLVLEEPKQETLEEVALNYAKQSLLVTTKDGFIAGAKWQAERMYSEEEVRHLMTLAFEQGFKKADVVEAGLEAKETDTEINWIFLKHKK